MTTELNNLIIENKWLITSIINKYNGYFDIDDLYQVAVIGIIKAYKKYKKNLNIKFSTYAYNYIFGEVYNFVNQNKNIKLNRELLSLRKKIVEAKNILAQRLMREPTDKELSLFLEIDERILNDLNNYSSVDSIDRVICDDGKEVLLSDMIPSQNNDNNIDYIYLHQEMEKLDKEERKILNMRYFEDKTQSEVADYFGVNQVQISREEKKILKKLRQQML